MDRQWENIDFIEALALPVDLKMAFAGVISVLFCQAKKNRKKLTYICPLKQRRLYEFSRSGYA